jgi:hypothetical protein
VVTIEGDPPVYIVACPECCASGPLWRSVKYEEVYLHGYGSIAEADRRLASYFDFYNRIRTYQSLDGMTPDAVHLSAQNMPESIFFTC